MDLKDTPASLMSAVRDIMMKNQNLYQNDVEAKYSKYSTIPAATPDEVAVDAERDSGAQDVDPETIIPGSSGTAEVEASVEEVPDVSEPEQPEE